MSEFKLLAIETSSPTGSIAISGGERQVERTIATPREQTPKILAIVDELLSEVGLALGDLDALVFGRGPGSFTGLRVAAAVVQGLSFAAGVPIVSVSSLAVLAQRAHAPRTLCCIDARMGEVYWASFRQAGKLVEPESDERIGVPEDVTPPEPPFVAVGDGFAAYPEALADIAQAAASVDSSLEPAARELLTLGGAEVEAGRFLPIDDALPVYLREADAWKKS